jgi:hypothetical protein
MDKRLMNINRMELLSRPAPCDGCENNTKCALDLKACRSFQYYVETGSINKSLSRNPTRQMFNSVFYADTEFTMRELRKQLRAETEL